MLNLFRIILYPVAIKLVSMKVNRDNFKENEYGRSIWYLGKENVLMESHKSHSKLMAVLDTILTNSNYRNEEKVGFLA